MQSLYFICNFLVTKYNSVSTLKCHTFTAFYYFTLQSLNIQPLVTYPKLNREKASLLRRAAAVGSKVGDRSCGGRRKGRLQVGAQGGFTKKETMSNWMWLFLLYGISQIWTWHRRRCHSLLLILTRNLIIVLWHYNLQI